MKLANRLKKMRNLKGMTRDEVASGILSKSHLSNVEGGRYEPSEEVLFSLADRLSVPYEYLTEFEDDNKEIKSKLENIEKLMVSESSSFTDEINSFEKDHPYIFNYTDEIRFFVLKANLLVKMGSSDSFIVQMEKELHPLIKNVYIDSIELNNQVNRLTGTLYFYKNDFVNAATYYRKLLQASLSDKYRCFVLYNLGLAYYKMGDLYDSVEYISKARDEFLNIHSWANTIDCYIVVGGAFEELKEYSKAKEQYQKALSLCRYGSKEFQKGMVLHNLGELYKTQGEFEDAIKYYLESADVKKKHEPESLPRTYIALMDCYLELSQFENCSVIDSKLNYLLLSEQFTLQRTALREEIIYKQGKKSNLQSSLEKAVGYFKHFNKYDLEKFYGEKLSELYFKERKYKKAYVFLKKYKN
ncbi:helix-turn-helix domain-containing protein [Halobacillus salinus]|uniref:helix-turn-helix domain-containing protein n=1 Tax=Halobacillus salinus TaxID=192814 RepID=UPI0009A6CAE4|nr:tetratricopeptide repeat protein [Halobacillus salinus]